MEKVEWTKDLSVQVEELDEQHKLIIAYINIVVEAINRNDSKLFIQDLLDSLRSHMSRHFGTEEKYFHKYNYPDAEKHRYFHAEYLKVLIRTIDDYKKTGKLDKNEIVKVFDWLTTHIKGVDMLYIDCFHEHGLK